MKEVLLGIAGQGVLKIDSPTPEVELLKMALNNYEKALAKFPDLKIKAIFPNSFGLYAGLVIAGAITLPVAIKLVRERADLVRRAEEIREKRGLNRTGMLSVLGNRLEDLQGLIERYELHHTNDNGPIAHVFAQTIPVLDRVRAELGAKRTRLLEVEGAYHSLDFRKDEIPQYAEVVSSVEIAHPQIPIISSTDPRELKTPDDIRQELVFQLGRQVALPEALALLEKVGGAKVFIDLGPTGSLTKLGKKISPWLDFIAIEEADNSSAA